MSIVLDALSALPRWVYALLAVLALSLRFLLLPYITDPRGIRDIPGPALARFSDFWLACVAGRGFRSLRVHDAHARYGTFVRIAPNHVSIADPEAIPVVLGHATGFLKSDFYDAFVAIKVRGLFNTRDRAEHTRKRKLVSHVFSQRNVLDFAPFIHEYLAQLVDIWDARTEGGQTSKFDTLPYMNFLAFDIIGALAFGRPFGMVASGIDSAIVGGDADKPQTVPAIRVLNERGDVSATLGCLPPWMRPFTKHLPWFKPRLASVSLLSKIAIAAVSHRLAHPPSSEPTDLLSKLQRGTDAEGLPLGFNELTVEALTQTIAGSDTTSNSSCVILHYLAEHPDVQRKLQEELDSAFGEEVEENETLSYDAVKGLPYLQAVIDESLRVHATSGIGLARVVPPEGAVVAGRFFVGGTILSCPTYTIHRLPSHFGDDAESFRPERWLTTSSEKLKRMQAAFMPFSAGPRGCVGRNLAAMELLLIISTLVGRYNLALSREGQKLEVTEGFLRKPKESVLRVSRRR